MNRLGKVFSNPFPREKHLQLQVRPKTKVTASSDNMRRRGRNWNQSSSKAILGVTQEIRVALIKAAAYRLAKLWRRSFSGVMNIQRRLNSLIVIKEHQRVGFHFHLLPLKMMIRAAGMVRQLIASALWTIGISSSCFIPLWRSKFILESYWSVAIHFIIRMMTKYGHECFLF